MILIKEALKIDSIINPDKGFNLNDINNIEKQKEESLKYNEVSESNNENIDKNTNNGNDDDNKNEIKENIK